MTLLCPRTKTPLKHIVLDGIELDISEGCGGVWFDCHELKRMDEAKESAGDTLIEILAPFKKDSIDFEERIHCPRCPNIVLMRSFYSPKRCFQIDRCAKCGGVWLDPGELAHLRSLFSTEEQREAYVRSFVDEVTQGIVKSQQQAYKEERATMEAVGSALRFITPSRYFRQSK